MSNLRRFDISKTLKINTKHFIENNNFIPKLIPSFSLNQEIALNLFAPRKNKLEEKST